MAAATQPQIVVQAADMSDDEMQDVARSFGHESGFVVAAPAGSECDFRFRFWVPNHEMEICGHATVGAVWLLDLHGLLGRDHVSIWTESGRVDAHVRHRGTDDRSVEITQPVGHVELLSDTDEAEILSVLGVGSSDRAPVPTQNAATNRVKTLMPIASVAQLDALKPDFERVEQLCERLGSTGLYPYATSDLDARVFDARQFPKSSGYPEDAATGIAAAALSFGLLANG